MLINLRAHKGVFQMGGIFFSLIKQDMIQGVFSLVHVLDTK